MLAGAAAGLTNGFFGGGGGSVLVPMLTRVCGLDQRRAFATSVAVILPLCALSAPSISSGADWISPPLCPISSAALWAAGPEDGCSKASGSRG